MRRFAVGVGCVLVATFAAAAPIATAHQGNPHFRTYVRSLSPATPGVKLQVLNFDDRLELTNRSGKTVTIDGYDNEPYARVLGDGTVEINRLSPANYLNDDRFAMVRVPSFANAKAPPQWKVQDKTGVFQWHDHRIHYMAKGVPAVVTDQDKRTHIFDWKVPVQVGSASGDIGGQLFWVPKPGGGMPVGAIVGLVIIVLLGLGAVLLVRRRRDRGHVAGSESGDVAEAW